MTDQSPSRAGRDACRSASACSSCRAAARSAPIRPAPIRRCVTMISSRNGSPAFRSAPSMPRSSPAIRARSGSSVSRNSGRWCPRRCRGIPSRKGDRARSLFNETSAALIATFGVPGFFTPRVPPAPLWPPGSPQSQSYYDTAPLKETLERLVDFDRINDGRRGSASAPSAWRRAISPISTISSQEARQEDRPGAHHGVRRAAAGLSVRSRSTASISGTAASSPTRRSTMCWMRRPAAIC